MHTFLPYYAFTATTHAYLVLQHYEVLTRTWCKDKGKGVATTTPPKHLKGLEKYLWKWRLPFKELDQLLLVRNVGLDACGCLCKASRIIATSLSFPHHVGAGGEESAS